MSSRNVKQHYPLILLPAPHSGIGMRVRVLDRRDRFWGDSFSETEAKVNCVMFRACVPYVLCVKPYLICVSMPNTVPCVGVRGRMGVWDAAECVECVCFYQDAQERVLVYCVIWLCVGSLDCTKSAPYWEPPYCWQPCSHEWGFFIIIFLSQSHLFLSIYLFEGKVTQRAGSVSLFWLCFNLFSHFNLCFFFPLLLVFFSHSILPLHVLQWSSQAIFAGSNQVVVEAYKNNSKCILSH